MNLEFTSWENGIDPATGAQVPGGMEAETRQALMFPDDMADSVITKAVYTELSLQEYPTRSPSEKVDMPKEAVMKTHIREMTK